MNLNIEPSGTMQTAEPQGEIIPLIKATATDTSPAQISEDCTQSSKCIELQAMGVPVLAESKLEAPELPVQDSSLGSELTVPASKEDSYLTTKPIEPQAVPLLEAPIAEGPSEAVRRRRWHRRFRPRRRPPRATKRILVLLCAVTIFSAIVVGIYFVVKHLERPIENKNSIPTGGNEPTTLCNGTDTYDSSTPSSAVSFRINTENSLLEIHHQSWQAWLPVCDERWNSSLGKLMCRYMGRIKYLNSSEISVSEIGPNYTQGFVEVSDGYNRDLEKMWSYRASCASGKVIKLKCSACGEKHDFSMIIGGQEAEKGNWPWQVTLYNNYQHMCGGSIIDGYWIITAAHCLHRSPHPYSWLVYAGILDRQTILFSSVTSYSVEKIIYHDDYDDDTHDSDIALMKLKKPVEFSDTVRAVCLTGYNQQITPGKQCWITGWGHAKLDAYQTENILKEASVPIISTEMCNSSCMYNGAITSRMFCAGYKEGKVDACQGDSGGPLVCENVQAWQLTGVVSWGIGCAEANHPGVYTKVSEFLDWIYSTIERLDTSAF
ncbi:transmembrane protease serine 5 [Chiloscyllium plagiosum]|uniref:transmembrane protease serine 5 n=1 Tax=Chiloscyllium plagiosum TaxID=36176 RepID=UPI001CB864E3|nr:transmembrane protease serine 5 [Chiloscyllium plagiosum]XP_043532493.1 transmembrane protease serine 5 [Chiloscyllium plagiosum]XP_043532494.1 transmembrane protease serine 5 [Chiloscyllium plagiosum]XP_043532495.1 transmembrane protease serine 5 [Chiloscyllium plagiosum]